jgi:hypothetical protein
LGVGLQRLSVKRYSKIKNDYVEYKYIRWVVRVCHEGVIHWVGTFKDEKDAALAYNKKALELHGEFAKLNVIE